MAKKNQSLINFLSTDGLNRLAEYRADVKWIEDKLRSPESIFIPVHNQKNLFENTSTHKLDLKPKLELDLSPTPVFLSFEEVSNFSTGAYSVYFLGEIGEKFYFAVNFESAGKEVEAELLKRGRFDEFRKIMSLMNPVNASLLAYARALTHWHSRNKYCGVCGSITRSADSGHKIVCTNQTCLTEYFPRTDPAIIVLVSKGNRCLLARQRQWPKGQYSNIAGFVEQGESLELAVKREVYEETGIMVNKISYHSSQPWPFPGSLMIGFHASAENLNISPHDNELEDIRWFTRQEIIKSLSDKTLRFPPPISVSFKLIEHWFDKVGQEKLRDLVK